MLKSLNIYDFIKPINSFADTYDRQTVVSICTNKLNANYGISTDVCDWIANIISSNLKDYADLDYHFIPVAENPSSSQILTSIYLRLIRDIPIIQMMDVEYGNNKKIIIDGLKPFEEGVSYTSKEEDGSVGTTTEYGKTITKSGSHTNNSMGENAPIDANIGDISFPNIKGKSVLSISDSDVNSGTDTENVTRDLSTDISNDYTNHSPELYEVYVQLARKFNLGNIVDNAIRYHIWEFNRIM